MARTTEVSAIRGRARTLFLLSVFFAVMAPFAGAYQEPPGGELPNLDYRSWPLSSLSPPGLLPSRLAALGKLQRQLPGVRVELDQFHATPRFIGSPTRFLTEADGNGGSAPVAGADDRHRVTKAFLERYRDVFGHGAEALQQARQLRDATSPHNGMRTTVWQQEFLGLRVFGACMVSHVTRDNALINISSQFVSPIALAAPNREGAEKFARASTESLVSLENAVAWAAEAVGSTVAPEQVLVVAAEPDSVARQNRCRAPSLLGDVELCLVWLPLAGDQLTLCWQVILTSAKRGEMFRVLIDAQTGGLWLRHNLTAYAAPASYRVFTSDNPSPFSPGHVSPSSTQPPPVLRQLINTVALDTNASPNGWIGDGGNETFGNNVDAHLDRNNDNLPDFPRPQGSPQRVFDFPLDLASEPAAYTNASVINLFYWINWTHDQLYRLGFTEGSGNFQNNNFGRGGVGNDAVQGDAQDSGGANNANFASPSDGSAGRMQMYLWSGPTPDRDGSLDAEIIIHEYVHGLSSRLVGGGVGLWELQSTGMGEGWSDFYALSLLSSAADDVNGNYAMGAYSSHRLNGLTDNYYYGIRRYPYTTDLNKNPLTFKDIDTFQASPHNGIPRNPVIANRADQVHNMGSVWCVALWEARAKFILKYGFDAGNRMILQLVTDGMKLSPANPNFLQARDGILQADLVNNQGHNHTELWQAFAKRGMGFSATSPTASTTSGIREAYDIADELVVTPAEGFHTAGPPGGPFTPSSQSLLLTNRGSNALTWAAASSAGWLQLSRLNGSLAGGEAVNVTASLGTEVAVLPAGNYSAVAWFTNVTKNVARSNVFTLRVGYDGLTELFGNADNDLDFSTFTFVPNGSPAFYQVCREATPVLPTDPLGGTALILQNDSFSAIDLRSGRTVSFFGARTNRLYISSNGYVTFDGGDATSSESIAAHFQRPRLSALFEDLNPQTAGSVSWKQLPDRIVITFLDVPQAGAAGGNTFQIELFFSGVIRLSYLSIATANGLVGLSNGGGVPPGFDESDFSAYPTCAAPPSPQALIDAAPPGSVLYLPRGIYAGPISIGKNLVLQGASRTNTIITGSMGSSVVTVATNCGVVLVGFTVRNGDTSTGPGGIMNAGDLELLDCIITQNRGQGGAGGIENYGTLSADYLLLERNQSAQGAGGMANFNSARLTNTTIHANVGEAAAGGLDNRASMVIAASTVSSNLAGAISAAGGGGIDNIGSLTLDRSTISGNKANGGAGGGLLNRGAGQATLSAVTIVQNETSTAGGGINHGGSGFVRLRGSLIAGNRAASNPDYQGTFTSDGWNFVQSPQGTVIVGTGDIVGQDPFLGSLRDNGGPAWTHALHASSPAVDAGAPIPLPLDQRGLARPYDWTLLPNANAGGPDIGAFELQLEDTRLVREVVLGNARNDVAGWVGVKLRVGARAVRVTGLGRFMLPGNKAVHTLKLVRAAGTDVAGGAVQVSPFMSLHGGFGFSTLAAPLTLPANGLYYVVSSEVAGGDRWLDSATVEIGRSAFLIESSIINTNGTWVSSGGVNTSSGPLNVLFESCTRTPPDVELSQPPPGTLRAAGSSVLLEASASDCDGLVTEVEFYANNSLLGKDPRPPFSLTWSNLPAGEYVVTARARDDTGLSATSSVVNLSVVAFTSRTFVTNKTLGSLRNDFNGWVGMQFTTGPKAVPVLALGRIFLSGNTGEHQLKLVKVFDGLDVPGTLVSVSMAGGINGVFRYASLPDLITLSPNTSYFLVSLERLNGNRWCDLNSVLGVAPVAACNGPVWGAGAGWNGATRPNSAYVPVDFIYGEAPPRAPVITGQPVSRSVAANDPVAFELTAEGEPPLQYQWRFNGAPLAGANNATHSIAQAQTTQAGNYDVVVANASGTVTSQVAVLTVTTPGSGDRSFVVTRTPGRTRVDFSGWVGMKITIGPDPLTLTHLGRFILSGNVAVHTVKLVNAATGLDVTGGTVAIAASGGVAGEFRYGALGSPVSLPARSAYYVVSQEVFNGDRWHDLDMTLTTTTAAQCNGAVWGVGSGWNVLGGPNQTYVPVDFKYTTSAPPPAMLSVSLTSPANGEAFGAPAQLTLTAQATPGQNPVARVEFYSGPSKLGEDLVAPYSFVLSNVSAGTYLFSARAVDAAQQLATSAVVQVTVSAAAAGDTFIRSATLGKQRNDFSGWVGLKFTVGAAPVQVSALGRMMVAGNSAQHRVKLVDAATGQDVSGGFADVPLVGGTSGLFRYASLPAPLTLPARKAFYLVSQEVLSGDRWHDIDTFLGTAAVGTCDGAVWNGGSGWNVIATPNQGYVPVDFKFVTGPVPPSVEITRPQDNAVFIAPAMVEIDVSATGNGSPITNVELFRSDIKIGEDASAPYVFTLSNAVAGNYLLSARAVDAQGLSATSSGVRVTVAEPGSSSTLVTAKTPGTLRQDFAGWVGMKLTVGASAVTVTELGRMVVAGNGAVHMVKLVRAADGADTASVTVATSGGTPGEIRYSSLPSPITLPARSAYYLVSQETFGGDQWFDLNTSITTSSAATCDGPVWGSGGGWNLIALPNRSYVPVDLRYLSGSLNDTPSGADAPLLSIELVGGHPRLKLSGKPGSTVVIEASDDLSHWERLLTRTLSAGVEDVAAPASEGKVRCYYRAVVRAP